MHRDEPGDIEPAQRGGAALGLIPGILRLPGSVVVRVPKAVRRATRIAVLAALVLGIGASGIGGMSGRGADAQTGTVGQWSSPITWPNVTIHSTLLPTGKVLSYSYPSGDNAVGESESWLWNPANSQFTEVPVTNGTNIFCSGHALLADGQVISVGGTRHDSPLPIYWGQNEVNRFNTTTQQWTYQTNMTQSRWYPSITTLSDGKLYISSGIDQTGNGNDEQEIYNPATGATTQLPPSAERYTTLYPWEYLLPNGRLLSVGNGNDTDTLNLGNNIWSDVDGTNRGARDQGTSALLPLKASAGYNPEVIILGGTLDGAYPAGTNTVERINMGAGTPTWANIASLHYGRRHANTTLLPDGKVLVTGGTGSANDPALARTTAEMYDPVAGTWTDMSAAQRPRMYHSMAMLLPDGRVLTAGTDGELTGEIYSPPYLFNGPRPTISGALAPVAYGSTMQVTTPDAAGITKVMLMKPSSVTHSVNMGQRAIELSFTKGSGVLNVTVPPNGNVAPPGSYMLFILNGSGVPSVAKWVHVSGSPAPSPSPTPIPTPTPTKSPTPTPTKSPTPTPTKSPTPTPTKSPTPTPTKSPTPTPTPSSTPTTTPSFTRADVDCDGVVTSADAVKVLRHVAGLPVQQSQSCPEPGTAIGDWLMGDVDCSGVVNAVDAVLIMRVAAGLTVTLPSSCPPASPP